MTRFYWTSDGTDGHPNDLQQSPGFDPIYSQTVNLNSLSSKPSLTSDDCVARLLRSWGRDQSAALTQDVSIDIWSELGPKLGGLED